MRIGLSGGGSTIDSMVRQAQQAEADGFSSLWYASGTAGDPLVAMAIAGRATETIELGTAVLQTYPCHPLLQANRVAAAANAMGRPGFTLGLGPSHEPIVRDVLGMSYEHPARNTEEYLSIIGPLLRGQEVEFAGTDWSAHSSGRMVAVDHPVGLLLSAMSPRMLGVAGRLADGVVLWMAAAPVIESRIVPRLQAAAAEAGRSTPRVVAGLPIAVHDDEGEARSAVAATASAYAGMTNYQRVIEAAGAAGPAEVAIVGDEAAVGRQLDALLRAGATDIWAQPVAVGADRAARSTSYKRTRAFLSELARHS
ncbi:TIGR03564 family F420-dependent LLM class oxidoreductase [Mycolicibacterium sp. 3033]|nr:TIGR03564 family F420-dependent LLM class oxidoreductase [Mycolicibacterium aurantiacum]